MRFGRRGFNRVGAQLIRERPKPPLDFSNMDWHLPSRLARHQPFTQKAVLVTNPHNGRSISVGINDRGPLGKAWRAGARLDLARGAARHFDMHGTQYVCVQSAGNVPDGVEIGRQASIASDR